MSPEELTPPVETPAPAPEPAPAPPPPTSEPAEPTLNADQFSAMAEMMGPRAESPLAGAEPVEPAPRERPERPARPAAPVTPTPPALELPTQPSPDAPKRWGGRYDTPEALEHAYKDIEAQKSRAEQAAQRLERLLLASLEGQRPTQAAPPAPAAPSRPVTPWNQQTALTAIREEAARLGLDDPQADPQRFIRAIAAALREDTEARDLYVAPAIAAINQQAEQQRQVQTLQTAFYTQFPDLKEVRPELLRQVAQETEQRLYRANPETYGSPEYVRQWFDETAREARLVFRVSSASGSEGNGAASAPSQSPSPPKASSAKPKGAPFAESPSPRPSEPVLEGQARHLARVFGRPG